MIKYYHKKEKATKISVELKSNTQEYALSFLHIWNNAREYPNMFYKVENNSGNSVFITCNPKYVDEVKEYLEQFGEIWDTEEINWIIISAECDMKGYGELFDNEECETDFTVEID